MYVLLEYFGGVLYENMWILVIQAIHSPKNFENIGVWITEDSLYTILVQLRFCEYVLLCS